jgi:hypothetical protein
MNIEELLQSLPSREDIASAVGLQARSNSFSNSSDLLPMLGLFGTGMLFGAGLALLFAPKSGPELRQDLSEKAQEWGNQAREAAEEYSGQSRAAQSGQSQAAESAHRSSYSGASGSRNI